MKKTKHIFSIFSLFLLVGTTNLAASTFFSGYAGGKINYSGNTLTEEEKKYDPDLKLQAFFAGQFNINQNMWTRMEISVDTSDFISDELFDKTDASFQVDELSFTFRGNTPSKANYFSAYMGTYDSIGSDIFLLRYFSIQPIASKLTESYLGLAGSILYPHFGIGIADIVKFYQIPVAVGGYGYINNANINRKDKKCFVLNLDGRAACAFPYFTGDFAFGLGAPLSNNYYGEDVILAISNIYWHAGTTMLIGNNYSPSLYLQAGLFNANFTASKKLEVDCEKDLYFLLEPRFYIDDSHLVISAYSIPQETIDDLLFLDDTFGIDVNLYSELLAIKGHTFTCGFHTGLSFPEITLLKNKSSTDDSVFVSGKQFITSFKSLNFNVNLTPYVSTSFLSGDIHGQLKIKIMNFPRQQIAEAFSVDIGYKTSF